MTPTPKTWQASEEDTLSGQFETTTSATKLAAQQSRQKHQDAIDNVLAKLVKYDFAEKSFYDKIGLSFIDQLLFEKLVHDKRDVMFIHWMIGLSAMMLTSAYLLITFRQSSYFWLLGILHLACYVKFLGPFILMLHCTSHSPFFKGPLKFMNFYNSLILGQFFGETPETYYCHHIKMHHIEGNGPNDLSSTWNYKRDKLTHFMHYYLRFIIFGVPELCWYFISKKQYGYFARTIIGEITYHCLGITIWYYFGLNVALVLYLIPITITRIGMVSGNWIQHAFIDQKNPNSDYKSSITCIHSDYNRWCFNDGYHTSHHLNPIRHWTEHPQHLVDRAHFYFDNSTIIFKDLDYHMIFVCLMMGWWEYLASKIVLLDGDANKPIPEIVAVLKERVMPVKQRMD